MHKGYHELECSKASLQRLGRMSQPLFPCFNCQTSLCDCPGGTPRKIWVGVCGPLPKTLTLFMTEICDFRYPIYDLTKTLYPIYDLTLLVVGFI